MNWRKNNFYRILAAKHPEALEHASLVEWLEWTKPGEWCHYPAEGHKTPWEQYMWKIMGGKKNISDFLFFDHRQGFCGLALELKKEGEVVFNKDGSVRADKQDQWGWLQRMKKIGWRTELIAGKENARKVIADYYGMKI